MYYHVMQVLKRLQVPSPHEAGFNAADIPYTNEEFFMICEDYGVPHDPMKYRDEKFYWTYWQGVKWPDDYIDPDSMTRWIIKKSQGFTQMLSCLEYQRTSGPNIMFARLCEIKYYRKYSECIKAQQAFLNNFENVVHCRIDIREDFKHYQDTLSYRPFSLRTRPQFQTEYIIISIALEAFRQVI